MICRHLLNSIQLNSSRYSGCVLVLKLILKCFQNLKVAEDAEIFLSSVKANESDYYSSAHCQASVQGISWTT